MSVMLLTILNALSLTAQSVPTNGALSQVAGGSITGATNYVKSTWVTSTGETAGSAETSLAVTTGNLLVVAPPTGTPPPNAAGWNVYVSTATGTETKQNATPIAVTASWTQPVTGLITGSAVPSGSIGQGTGPQLLDVSPFEGGRNRNAFLNLAAVPAGGGVIGIYGTDLPAGGPTPSPTDPSWTLLYTLNSSSPLKQEIQLPVWLQANVTTVGTGTTTAQLEGIQ